MTDRLVVRAFLSDTLLRVVAAAVIGLLTAIAVAALTGASAAVFSWWAAPAGFQPALPDATWLISLGCALFAGATIVTGLLRLLPDGKVSGPPDTLHTLADPDHRIPTSTGILSTLIAGTSTATGASVGLYGPLIHFGSVLADLMRRVTGTERISWQTLVGCGVAAAISAAFLTPIGAALFATEFVMRRINLRDFLPLAIASTTAWGAALLLGTEPVFTLGRSDFALTATSLALTAALGIILGCAAMAFSRAVEICVSALPSRLPAQAFSPFWAAGVMFILGAFLPPVLGTGVPFLQSLFEHDYSVGILLTLLLAKFVATGVCVAMRFYGGLFAPALFVGGVTGAICGSALLATPLGAYPDVQATVHAFPVIAAFAVASALVGAPLAAAIIILEMTGSYQVAALGFATCVICCYIYSSFMGRSFFDRRLRDRGVSFEETTPVRRLAHMPIRELAVSLEDIREADAEESRQIAAVGDAATSPLHLDPEMPALAAMRAMDASGTLVAEVDLDRIGIQDDRRFVHRELLDQIAWKLTLTDSEANTITAMQSRDFVSLFESDLARDLLPSELETLEVHGRLRVVRNGESLIRQGEGSRNFFILNAGLVRISQQDANGEETTLAWLRSGAVFGEVSFLTGDPRNADATAASDCIVQEFRPEFVGLASRESEMGRALFKLATRRGVRLKEESGA